MSDDFFSRWSRRKQGLEKGEAPQPDPVVPQAPGVHAVVNASAPASVANVPVVGKVTPVAPVIVNVDV